MENTKDKGSRSASKTNLNESTQPLLDDLEVTEGKGETPEKDQIEMELKSEEKEDLGKEKLDGEDGQIDAETKADGEAEKKGKKKKEKKEKAPKTHKRTVSLAEKLTIGLNLLDRDEHHINDQVNLVFEDVLAEPDATHGFDAIWRVAFIVFSGTKYWVYRVLAALVAVPCGLLWGLIFSLLTLLNVWFITPVLRILQMFLYVVRRVWSGVIRTILDPLFQSAGTFLGGINIRHTTCEEIVKEP